MVMARLSALVALLLIAGCGEPAKTESQNTLYVRGNAKIVSIEPDNGHAVLDYEGRRVDAFWKTEVYLAQGGAFLKNDPNPMKPPVGQYAEPVAKQQTIHAKPGDSISFVGMTTPSGILLRSVSVTPAQ